MLARCLRIQLPHSGSVAHRSLLLRASPSLPRQLSRAVAMSSEWREKLEDSLRKNKKLPYGKYYQLATLRSDGRPANRTVVHRGFYGDNGLELVTDRRSKKVQEVKTSKWGEIAWYFEHTREQYRLSGSITIVGHDHPDQNLVKERKRVWSGMSPPGRAQFLNPHPGEPRAGTNEDLYNQEAPPPGSDPTEDFCLVVIDVVEVDYLSLKGNVRWEHKSTEQDGKRAWSSLEVNP